MWSSLITDGAGYLLETVFINPRPLRTKLALSEKIKLKARLVEQTLSGSKFAFKINTGEVNKDLNLSISNQSIIFNQ